MKIMKKFGMILLNYSQQQLELKQGIIHIYKVVNLGQFLKTI